jgi:RPA family protein
VSGREPAWRVFSNELLASSVEEKGTGEWAASYLLSPLGARMNRVLLFGRLDPPETLGNDEARPFLRSRLTDPTGTVTVTAGSYQPRALAALRAVTCSGEYMVVGKAHRFVARNGTAYPSVRAEALRNVDAEDLGGAWAEAADQTLTRIEIVEGLRAGRAPTGGARPPTAWAEGARACATQYPSTDTAVFRAGLEAVASALAAPAASPGTAPATPSATVPPLRGPASVAPAKVRVTHTVPAAPSEPGGVSAAARAQESSFLDIVDELSERSTDGYADLREATSLVTRRGIPAPEAEQILARLEEEGVLEEPVVGKIRRA